MSMTTVMRHLSLAAPNDTTTSHGGLIQYVERNDRPLSDVLLDLEPMQEATDLRDLYAGLARAIVIAVRADACLISVLDEDGETLRDVSASVVSPAHLNDIADEYQLSDYPLTREVIDTRQSSIVSVGDSTADRAEARYLKELGYSHVILACLTLEGRGIGIVEAYRVDERPFRTEDPRQIEVLTRFAMNSYANIKLASRLESHYTETIETLVSALEARNPDTNAHAKRIPALALGLASAMHLPIQFRRTLRLGSILHDVGKIGVPDSILLKPAALTDDEWQIMRQHPAIGEQMLRPIDFLSSILPIVRHHHERWDGGGYPDGLVEKKIPLGARIVTVCDTFDAMISDRPYRAGLPVSAAVEELLKCSGTQFDPRCAEALVDLVTLVGEDSLEEKLVRFAIP
jgi:HD-GYP domain-containing protein (c-di-GMP phosphodiesterase class II)